MNQEVEEFLGPDLVGQVAGVRSWHPAHVLDPNQIFSFGDDAGTEGLFVGWKPGENESVCTSGSPHKSPAVGCACGFYAYHDTSRFKSNATYGNIFGVVAGWGNLMVARDGFRSEFSQIIALSPGPESKKEDVRQCEQAAKYYKVPIVQFHELDEIAMQIGLVPDELRPGKLSAKEFSDKIFAAKGGFVGSGLHQPHYGIGQFPAVSETPHNDWQPRNDRIPWFFLMWWSGLLAAATGLEKLANPYSRMWIAGIVFAVVFLVSAIQVRK